MDTFGYALYYEGERGEERYVRGKLPNGTIWHYEGEKGEEQLVSSELPNGMS